MANEMDDKTLTVEWDKILEHCRISQEDAERVAIVPTTLEELDEWLVVQQRVTRRAAITALVQMMTKASLQEEEGLEIAARLYLELKEDGYYENQ